MYPFEYANPTTVKDAVALLGASWSDANILAGGTDQMNLMKDDLHQPKRLVNIKSIKALGGISRSGAGIRIGATVTSDELMENGIVRAELPALVAAARGIGSQQIRNMGTVAGDLCQRPRCWYFRNGFGLLGNAGGKDLVTAGQNEFHAIFPKGAAKFVSASSYAPALVALGASVTIVGPSGSRKVSVADFFLAPSSGDQREIDLKPNEIVTEILIPSGGMKNAIYEVRQKEGLDWPLVAAAVALKMKGATIESAQVVLGHVGPTPVVSAAAAAALAGKSMSEDVAAAAGAAAAQGAMPLSGNVYKVDLVKVAVKRALLAVGKA